MRFGSGTPPQVMAECMLKYYRILECTVRSKPESHHAASNCQVEYDAGEGIMSRDIAEWASEDASKRDLKQRILKIGRLGCGQGDYEEGIPEGHHAASNSRVEDDAGKGE